MALKIAISMDDCYPPLYSLNCFKNVNPRKCIDYSNGKWGGLKSDDKHFPRVSDINTRRREFPNKKFITLRNKLDVIIEYV